jgi:hypothetical protein
MAARNLSRSSAPVKPHCCKMINYRRARTLRFVPVPVDLGSDTDVLDMLMKLMAYV